MQPAARSGTLAADHAMYFVALNHEKAGPFTLDQLREMWRAGRVNAQTLFWENGMADWLPLERATAQLGLSEHDSLRFAPPSSTAPEPSAYDLPASHLPFAPVSAPAPAPPLPTPTLATLPTAPVVPNGPHSLIAPTALSTHVGPANPGQTPPTFPTAGSGNEVPPAAYVSLGCAVGWPVLLFLHVVGVFLSLAMMIAAVICGHSARAAIKASGGKRPGLGIATAGMALGYLSLALGVVMVLLVLAGVAMFVYAYSQGAHH